MFLTILFIALQAQSPLRTQSITRPETTSVTKETTSQMPILPQTEHKTTPTLNPESAITGSIEYVMGTQAEAVVVLKEKVNTLQENREKYDRPDINDLKSSRERVAWTGSILITVLLTVGSLIWYFRNFLWTACLSLLRREILGKSWGLLDRE